MPSTYRTSETSVPASPGIFSPWYLPMEMLPVPVPEDRVAPREGVHAP